MKSLKPLHLRSGVRTALLCLCLAPALLIGGLPTTAPAQPAEAETPAGTTTTVVTAGGTNTSTIILAGSGTNRTVRLPRNATASLAGDTNALTLSPDLAKAADTNSDEIQLSFQGADVNMIVQWLMQTTGKSVLKSQQVQWQVTITSSKKLPKRQAIDLVYRALALEGLQRDRDRQLHRHHPGRPGTEGGCGIVEQHGDQCSRRPAAHDQDVSAVARPGRRFARSHPHRAVRKSHGGCGRARQPAHRDRLQRQPAGVDRIDEGTRRHHHV